MSNVGHSQTTQSDVVADSCNIVLETSPPDYVKKMSRYLEEQTRRDESWENSAEEDDSDSGDSMFITQAPVPEPVRSRRRTAPAPLHGSKGDTLLSDSHGKSKSYKKRRNYSPPKHSFFSLDGERPRETVLHPHQNIRLHNFAMGGFFQSVKQLWQNYQRGVESSLPTVDADGECLSPISEAEEENNEDVDIKVVPRRWLVVPSTTKKLSRPWYTPTTEDSQLKQQKKKTGTKVTQLTPQRGHEIRATATVLKDTPSSRKKCLDDKESSPTSDRNDPAGTETPRAKISLAREIKKVTSRKNKRKCDLYNNRDATVCEPSPDGHVETDREASAAVAEPQADVFRTDEPSQTGPTECEPETPDLLQSDTNNDTEREKDEEDDESVEDGKGQSPEEPEGQDAAVEIAEVTPSLSRPTDEPELHKNGDDDVPRQEKGDGFNSELKEKRQRKALEAEDASQEVDGVGDVRVEEEPALLGNGDPEDGDGGGGGGDVEQLESSPAAEPPNDEVQIRKKKTKRKKETDVRLEDEPALLGNSDPEDDGGGGDVKQLESSPAAEPPNDDVQIRKKKMKRKKESDVTSDQKSTEQLEEEREHLGTTEASQETLESSFVKRKKKKKHQTASNEDTQEGEGDCQDVNFSNDVTTLEESAGLLVKKKKKKKKKKRTSDTDDIAVTPEDDVNSFNTQITTDDLGEQDAEVATKKKKKKKKRKSGEISSMEISSNTVAQSDDSVSARKEEKRRTSSFLVADAEGKAAQTHEGKHPPSQSTAAAVEFANESAEIARGRLQESNGEVRKKKKKRKRKMSDALESADNDHDPDFEEPNEMSEMTAAETGLKKKEKRKRTESQSLNDMERLQSPTQTDEVVVLKKKKKKKKKTKGNPPASTEENELEISTPQSCSSVSYKKNALAVESKVKHSSTKTSQATEEAPSLETPVHQLLDGVTDEKKRRKLEKKSPEITRTPNVEAHKAKEEKMKVTAESSFSPKLSKAPLTQLELSSSHSNKKNKLAKGKRQLYSKGYQVLMEFDQQRDSH
ncbi:trichohyalin-like isoform X2 [Mugil cephalus]|uniref:trichohyalin-like isoform X2 n=1 Tax=Mugil cephalus TaxID=48193 RepID=UPI001FB84547|nr:trichohyalin-like isoform X2 [Mugil cephalus]